MSASASKSALLLSPCLRWASPGAREYRDEYANVNKRDKGSLTHHGMDLYYHYGRNPSAELIAYAAVDKDPQVARWVASMVTWSINHLEPRCESIESEVYVATNFATGEVHSDPKVHDRQYPDKQGFLAGTADLVCVLLSGELLVADWKTGGSAGSKEQLYTLACGLRHLYAKADGSLRDVLVSVLLCGEQAGEAGCFPQEWAVTEAELEAHATAMQFQLADVGVRNDPVTGIHCSQLYCPHLAYCPGVAAVVGQLAAGDKGLVQVSNLTKKFELTDELTSDEHAGYVAAMLAAAKRQAAYYDTVLRKYVDDGGRVVSGDFEWKQTNSGMRWGKRS